MDLTAFKSMESASLPVKKGRIVKSMAESTIRDVTDAIVELVTNSDDSYSREEQKGNILSGQIHIFVRRAKGGHCKEVKVVDAAAGMDYKALREAIEFGGETSGFKKGKTVRGFFGRGLKEAIIALGKGAIISLHENVLSVAEIWYDEEKKDPRYDMKVPLMNPPKEKLKEFRFFGDSGTIVNIQITNERKDYIPGPTKIEEHLTKHYSLREINSSPDRSTVLHYSEVGRINEIVAHLKYFFPQGKVVFDKDINVHGDRVHFRIRESTEQLETPRTAHGTAGLLIKAEGAILDNQLFGYEVDPAGLYFFGTITCPGIAKIIRSGDDTIVGQNRGGLAWRHPYCKKLEQVSKEVLLQLIKKKKEELKSEKKTKVSESVEKMLDKLCKKLSDLAKDEVEDNQPGPGEIEHFTIRPLFANIEAAKPRSFGVYAPKYLAEDEGTKFVKFSSSNERIHLINPAVILDYYKKDKEVLAKSFKVVGEIEGETATITASLGNLVSKCEVRVGPLKERKKRKRTKGGGGMFRKIVPARDAEPIQRFNYLEGGIIKVFVKFPGVEKYLGESFENASSPEGRAILAEIIIEAFCRHVSRNRAEKYFPGEMDPLMSDMDRLRKKASLIVYDTIFRADLKDILD